MGIRGIDESKFKPRYPGRTLHRWMMFVDGSALTTDGVETLNKRNIEPKQGDWFEPETFIWLPKYRGTDAPITWAPQPLNIDAQAVRTYYYTSRRGDEGAFAATGDKLRRIGLTPRIFKSSKTRSSKGLDIALAKDFVANSYRNNFDIAFLVAGDEAYVPVVEVAERLGKLVYVVYFHGESLSDRLRRCADTCYDLTHAFVSAWQEYAP